MIKFRSEETIARPIEEVRAFLGNHARYGEWMPVEDVHMISGTADKTGSTMGMLMGGPGGRKFNMEFVIAEATPRSVQRCGTVSIGCASWTIDWPPWRATSDEIVERWLSWGMQRRAATQQQPL